MFTNSINDFRSYQLKDVSSLKISILTFSKCKNVYKKENWILKTTDSDFRNMAERKPFGGNGC
jgi:hypothetical protein